MLGGMHRQILYLAKYLDKTLFDSIVCTHNSPCGGLKEEFWHSGAKIYDLQRKFRIDINIIYRLIRILYLEKPDIVFITEPQNLFYYRIAKLFVRFPIKQIGSFRALGFWIGHKNYFFRMLDNYLSCWLIRTSTGIVCVSRSVEERFLKLCPRVYEKFSVIYNGSDFNFNAMLDKGELKRKHGIKADSKIILQIAHYDAWKDFDTLLKAIQIVVLEKDDIVFLLAGEGNLRREIEAQVRSMHLEKYVKLIGLQKPIYDYINASEFVVLSTFGEGFSNAILESMSLGKTVVATNVGGNPELMGNDNTCGFLFEMQDYLTFANRIIELLDNPALAYDMGISAKNRVEVLCNIRQYIKEYEKTFSDVYNARQ